MTTSVENKVAIQSRTDQRDTLEISVLRTFEEIEQYRPVWQDLQSRQSEPVINSDIDRYISVIEAFADDFHPFVIVIKQNSQPITMLIARLEEHQLNLKLGYKTLFKPKLKSLTVEYGGIIGQLNNELCEWLVRELMRILREYKLDIVHFNHLRTDSPLYPFVRKVPSFLRSGRYPKIETHWTMEVPEDIESFYKSCSPSNRKQFKKCIRKLDKAFPGQIRIATYSKPDELDEVIDYASKISAKTYQYAIGCGFEDNFSTRTLLEKAAHKGWLRADILFINNQPCAFEVWLRYYKTYFGNGIGFDPDWKKWRVGTVLFLNTIELIGKDPSANSVNFGFGDADYKKAYADNRWDEASLYIFAPRLYPVFINTLKTLVTALSLAAEKILKKTGFLAWVKRRWRDALQTKKNVSVQQDS